MSRHLDAQPRVSALVQTFGDGANAAQVASRLRVVPSLELIVNDDSGRDHGAWLAALRGGSHTVLSLPNVHEIRAYNRMARLARGEFLLMLQGDFCMPSPVGASAPWLERALSLFERHPNLGMVGGLMGFDQVPLRRVAENISWGTAPCAPIPTQSVSQSVASQSVASRTAAAGGGRGDANSDAIPFRFVAGVNIGPLLVRRSAFLRAGGFDEAFSCAGEPGIQLDLELSLQLWRLGYEVGVTYSAVSNGVGGRKTRTNRAQKRARNQNDAINGARCARLLRTHDAQAVAAANARLSQIERPFEVRARTLRELGHRPPSQCAGTGR